MGTAAWEFNSIPIDFEVFKALTARLESATDSYNGVLRRVLGLRVAPVSSGAQPTTGRLWIVDGVSFTHGTEFRAKYKGKLHLAVVQDGALLLNGVRYDTPSPAAMSITHSNVNGWRFWECRRPGQSGWSRMDSYRAKSA
jgi:hypothetical protein